jgi:hypothetical protein
LTCIVSDAMLGEHRAELHGGRTPAAIRGE